MALLGWTLNQVGQIVLLRCRSPLPNWSSSPEPSVQSNFHRWVKFRLVTGNTSLTTHALPLRKRRRWGLFYCFFPFVPLYSFSLSVLFLSLGSSTSERFISISPLLPFNSFASIVYLCLFIFSSLTYLLNPLKDKYYHFLDNSFSQCFNLTRLSLQCDILSTYWILVSRDTHLENDYCGGVIVEIDSDWSPLVDSKRPPWNTNHSIGILWKCGIHAAGWIEMTAILIYPTPETIIMQQ